MANVIYGDGHAPQSHHQVQYGESSASDVIYGAAPTAGPLPPFRKLKFADGGKYKGYMKNDVPHGFGESTDPSGSIYTGKNIFFPILTCRHINVCINYYYSPRLE